MNDIRALTGLLADDPSSLAFLDLGEALRRQGLLDAAYRVARGGVQRHPRLADGHDLLARILVDREDPERAFEAWASALEADPTHAGAHRGIAFLYFRVGDRVHAEQHLAYVVAANPDDAAAASALARLRAEGPALPPPGTAQHDATAEMPAVTAAAAPTAATTPATAPAPTTAPLPVASAPATARAAVPATPAAEPGPVAIPAAPRAGEFEEAASEPGVLLLDAQGLRLAGTLRDAAGADVGDAISALLSGVSREAERTARLLNLGAWQGLAVEATEAHLALAAPTADTMLLLVRDASVPLGRVALDADRLLPAARAWLGRIA